MDLVLIFRVRIQINFSPGCKLCGPYGEHGYSNKHYLELGLLCNVFQSIKENLMNRYLSSPIIIIRILCRGGTHKQQRVTIYMFTRIKSRLIFVENNLQRYQSAKHKTWCFLNGKIMCVSAAHLFLIFFSGWGTLVEAATFMFMNCCFCGSPQHNLISKGQGQLQGLDFYQGIKYLYRVCLCSMIVHTTQV